MENDPVEPATVQSAPVSKNSSESWKVVKKTWRNSRWILYESFPKIFRAPLPTFAYDKDYSLKSDQEDNERSRLADNQDVELRCIWVCEVFGPRDIANLYDGLRSLRWDAHHINNNRSPIEWVKNQRQYGRRGYFNLGWVTREKPSLPSSMLLTGPVPSEFSSLIAQIHQISPSLTCLLIGFLVSESEAKAYRMILNANYRTSASPVPGTRTIWFEEVDHKKRKATEASLLRVRKAAVDWMNSHFPGYFGHNSTSSRQPTGELMFLTGFDAFELSETDRKNWLHWSKYLNLDSHKPFWYSKSVKALRFAFGRNTDRLPHHVLVAVNWANVPDGVFKYYDAKSSSAKIDFVHERLDEVLAYFASVCFLEEVRSNTTRTRESLRKNPKVGEDTYSQLAQIEDYFQRNIGISMMANELKELSKDLRWFEHMVSGFLQRSPYKNDNARKPLPLTKWFQAQLAQSSETTLAESSDSRDFFQQLTTVLGTKENVSTQREIHNLTVVTVALAILSLFIAIVSLLISLIAK
jgi:hypothetical protein